MSLTLRNVKGSPLTYTEMDNNLTYLEGLGATGSILVDDINVSGDVIIGGGLTVSGTASVGDVVVGNGKKIKGASGSLSIEVVDGDLVSSVDLDPSFANTGNRLYVEDTNTGDNTSLSFGIGYSEFVSSATSDVSANNQTDTLFIDPQYINNGSGFQSLDNITSEQSQFYITPTQVNLFTNDGLGTQSSITTQPSSITSTVTDGAYTTEILMMPNSNATLDNNTVSITDGSNSIKFYSNLDTESGLQISVIDGQSIVIKHGTDLGASDQNIITIDSNGITLDLSSSGNLTILNIPATASSSGEVWKDSNNFLRIVP